jgi:hypothetical protein
MKAEGGRMKRMLLVLKAFPSSFTLPPSSFHEKARTMLVSEAMVRAASGCFLAGLFNR